MTRHPHDRTVNTFQRLVDSDLRLYDTAERAQRAVCISREYLDHTLIPAILSAAVRHRQSRRDAIFERIRGTGTDAMIARTVEVLADSHYRKQRNFGPSREMLATKARRAREQRSPIELVGLMFTRKNICPLKRGGGDEGDPDLAELLALIQLESFAALLAEAYPDGARITALSEGTRFALAFGTPAASVARYQARLREWIRTLGLRHMTLDDHEDFVTARLSPRAAAGRKAAYERALEEYRRVLLPLLDPADVSGMSRAAIERDLLDDVHNPRRNFIPLWDSIRHSIRYPVLSDAATAAGVQYEYLYREIARFPALVRTDPLQESLRATMIEGSWLAAIEHNARYKGDLDAGIDPARLIGGHAFRTTIRPKPDSEHLGINFVRETTRRVHPWHGMALVRLDGSGRGLPTVLSKLELEDEGAFPVHVDSLDEPAFFYATPAVAQILATGGELEYNLDPRA